MQPPRTPTEIDAIAERWVDTSIELDPEIALFLGRPGFDGRYADYSTDGLQAAADAQRAVLAELAGASVADETDLVTKTDLTRALELEVEIHESGLPLRQVNNLASPVQSIREAFDLEPDDSEEGWVRIGARLGNVTGAVDGYVQRLREGIRRGIVPARRQVALAAQQAASFAAADGFFRQLADRGLDRDAVPTTLAADLARGSGEAAAAYADLARFLTDELAPVASDADAIGRDHYALLSRHHVGATLDLDETYEWGVAELARMAGEQAAVAARIAGGSVEDAIAALDADPSKRIDGTVALQAWMQQLSDAAIDALGGTHFTIEGPVRELECRIAPSHSGVIYYTPPADDFSRPGTMWWSVPEGVDTFGTWRETTTVYHEGVPGHHLQIATAVAQRAGLNTWRRQAGTSGYWEGWALYAERLMAELGYLDDPADRLGMLDGQRMRAARVVLDIGVHLGKTGPDGRPWDYEQALALFRENVHSDEATQRFEVERYFGWPGQAPAYKVGQRVWEQIRAKVAEREGDAFDLRAFHDRALALGGMGLDTLRSVLTAPAS